MVVARVGVVRPGRGGGDDDGGTYAWACCRARGGLSASRGLLFWILASELDGIRSALPGPVFMAWDFLIGVLTGAAVDSAK